MKYLFACILFVILIFLCAVIIPSRQFRETFLASRCAQYNSCKDCSNASGCSWCPKDNACLSSTSLKSTDKQCNQSNTISSSFRCNDADAIALGSSDKKSDAEQYDFAAFKDRIANKIPPPNAYMSEKIKYSNEDVVSNMNDVRNYISNLQLNLPGIITSSMENGIKPMVKGVLSQNFAAPQESADIQGIQGFANMDDNKRTPFVRGEAFGGNSVSATSFVREPFAAYQKKSCSDRKSCSDCTDSTKCGWDPLKLKCTNQTPDKRNNITQKERCVTTPSTLNLMRTQPN
jgi:hypothetical protein